MIDNTQIEQDGRRDESDGDESKRNDATSAGNHRRRATARLNRAASRTLHGYGNSTRVPTAAPGYTPTARTRSSRCGWRRGASPGTIRRRSRCQLPRRRRRQRATAALNPTTASLEPGCSRRRALTRKAGADYPHGESRRRQPDPRRRSTSTEAADMRMHTRVVRTVAQELPDLSLDRRRVDCRLAGEGRALPVARAAEQRPPTPRSLIARAKRMATPPPATASSRPAIPAAPANGSRS